MRLRTRLTLTLALALLPLAAGVVVVQHYWQTRTTAMAIAEATEERVDERFIARCEAAPDSLAGRGRRGRFNPRRRRGRIWAYDVALQPTTSHAPPLAAELQQALGHADLAWRTEARGQRRVLQVALRVAADGPCAVVMVERDGARFAAPVWPALLFALLSVLAASLAAGPIVRRIRRLTHAVSQAQLGEPLPADTARDEIGELSRAFATNRLQLADRAEQLARRERALSTFVANTTHDVAIPLTVLQGHLIALQQRAVAPTDTTADIERALEESHYIGSLIRNLGAAAQLERVDQPCGARAGGPQRVDRASGGSSYAGGARETDRVSARGSPAFGGDTRRRDPAGTGSQQLSAQRRSLRPPGRACGHRFRGALRLYGSREGAGLPHRGSSTMVPA